jgi:hypothetical protein
MIRSSVSSGQLKVIQLKRGIYSQKQRKDAGELKVFQLLNQCTGGLEKTSGQDVKVKLREKPKAVAPGVPKRQR